MTKLLRRRVEPWADQLAVHYPIGSISLGRLVGDACHLLSEPDDARENYARAMAICGKVGHRPELAITRAHLGELLLDHYPDEHDAAIEHLASPSPSSGI